MVSGSKQRWLLLVLKTLWKNKYLCTSNYDEAYYDFHCLPSGVHAVDDGLDWYTICGTKFTNHMEYILVVSAFSLLGLYVYIQMLQYSGKQRRLTRSLGGGGAARGEGTAADMHRHKRD